MIEPTSKGSIQVNKTTRWRVGRTTAAAVASLGVMLSPGTSGAMPPSHQTVAPGYLETGPDPTFPVNEAGDAGCVPGSSPPATPAIKVIESFLFKSFPGSKFNGDGVCKKIGDTDTWSLHAVGRAADIKAKNDAQRLAIMRCLVANYRVLGIQRVIDEGVSPWQAWNAKRGTWETNTGGLVPRNVHFEVNKRSAGTATSPSQRPGFNMEPCGAPQREPRLSSASWYLRNSNSGGAANITFNYGRPGDIPIVGDWDGNGTVTPGVVRKGTWYLRNGNLGGVADVAPFNYGRPGDIPIVGDWQGPWDGSRAATAGVAR
jgi:hypothetical protein